jgi:uncharacterized surface protein with fasciclin (FAS1) repeats
MTTNTESATPTHVALHDIVDTAVAAVDATNGVTVGGATVVTADIETTNGVIHVIDAVIMPPTAA